MTQDPQQPEELQRAQAIAKHILSSRTAQEALDISRMVPRLATDEQAQTIARNAKNDLSMAQRSMNVDLKSTDGLHRLKSRILDFMEDAALGGQFGSPDAMMSGGFAHGALRDGSIPNSVLREIVNPEHPDPEGQHFAFIPGKDGQLKATMAKGPIAADGFLALTSARIAYLAVDRVCAGLDGDFSILWKAASECASNEKRLDGLGGGVDCFSQDARLDALAPAFIELQERITGPSSPEGFPRVYEKLGIGTPEPTLAPSAPKSPFAIDSAPTPPKR
jgi:hypothetical protein